MLGFLEGVLHAVGEELSELAGSRTTRVSVDTAEGVTDLPVESTFEWPISGAVWLDGQRYDYAGTTPTQLLGLDPPLASGVRRLDPVVEWSRTYSARDQARRQLLVGTAEEEYLDALGLNYGIERIPGLSDAQHQQVIQTLAFGPRGTIYLLERILDIVLGPGNYRVFQDRENHPCTVFVVFSGLATSAQGRGYWPTRETIDTDGATASEVELSLAPVAGDVRSIRAAYVEGTTEPNLLNHRVAGSVDAPDVVIDGTGALVAGDDGCLVRVSGGTASHGRNNGTYRIDSLTVPTHGQVVGAEYRGGIVRGTREFWAPPHHRDPFSPQDAGVQAALGTGDLGLHTALTWTAVLGGDGGNAITVEFVDPGAASPLQVNVAGSAITVTLMHDGAALVSTASQVAAAVNANVSAAALVSVVVAGSSGAGVVQAEGPTNLAGGEDGKFLTISGSSAGNDGTYPIATYISPECVILDATLAPEDGLTWRKDPNFDPEGGLVVEVIGAATLTESGGVYTLHLRTPAASPPAATPVEVHYSTVLSGQILQDSLIRNDPVDSYHPLYAVDPMAHLRVLLGSVVNAGITLVFQN